MGDGTSDLLIYSNIYNKFSIFTIEYGYIHTYAHNFYKHLYSSPPYQGTPGWQTFGGWNYRKTQRLTSYEQARASIIVTYLHTMGTCNLVFSDFDRFSFNLHKQVTNNPYFWIYGHYSHVCMYSTYS